MVEDIKKKILEIDRDGIKELLTYLETKTDYFTCPASSNYHSNFEQGLIEHCNYVTDLFREKNDKYNLGLSEDSIRICGFMHDLCKCNFYTRGKKNVKENGKWIEKEVWEINDTLPLGHGEKSIILLQRFIDLNTEEVMIIRWHMGLPEDYMSKKSYEKAVEKYKSIIAFCCADTEASYLLEKTIK
jgi:HD superfamily phosphohydrolase YqeK